MICSIRITATTTSVSASSATRRMAKAMVTLPAAWLSSTSISFPRNQSGRLNPRRYSLLLTRCSTGIHSSNNAARRNPAIELDSDLYLPTPTSNSPHTSSESEGLVFDLGPRDSWDSTEIGSPVVKRYIGDNEERWYMWYHGRGSSSESDADQNNSGKIGLAVSSNGIHWTRGSQPVMSSTDVGVVMNCSKKWWAFDTRSIRPSEMVIMSSPMYSSVYWLYYTGFSSEQVEVSVQNPERFHHENTKISKIFKSLPGLACSQDGRHWARIEGDHHTGALLDVGSGKQWDSSFIAAPQVVVHASDDMRMYYYSFDAENGNFAIGVARSRDGIRWVKLGKIMGRGKKGSFDELGVRNPCVIKSRRDGNYLMAYEGVGADGKSSIGLAASEDGLKDWGRVQEEPILEASDVGHGWDNEEVRSPCMIEMEDEWRLYYVGVGKGGRTGIGMAVSEGSNIRIFGRSSPGLTL
ncbi:hypothetical protein MANES_01G033900v8 [Manihot esculenta]|uniref:Uncharacterized protein n=1 Tax=Manihot esculenta TaxID=3983 RepID=A0ACB7IBZ6_MANES|nr:hypothetical protein MANES_01G033900v8 [Manihot esculenta]